MKWFVSYLIVLCLVIFSFVSCNQQGKNNNDSSELELKRKELELREKELELKERELNMTQQTVNYSTDSRTKERGLSELYNEVKSGVYIIYASNDYSVSQGSAFVVDDYGLAISNYHVFEEADSYVAINHLEQKFMITDIYEYDEENDYVIFRIGESIGLDFLDIANTKLAVGEKCFTIGTPRGMSFTLSEGIISGYRNNNSLIQTTTNIAHGSSGGPLMNREGKVIGITTSTLGEGNLNFAVNIKELPLSKYLGKQPFASSGQKSTISHSELKNFVQRYYQILTDKDFNSLYSMYASTLRRYYNKYDVSASQVVQIARDYNDIFNVRKASHYVRWDTFESGRVGDYYVVDFILDLKLDRYDRNKDSNFVSHIIMVLDGNKRIVSIYEDIINKY